MDLLAGVPPLTLPLVNKLTFPLRVLRMHPTSSAERALSVISRLSNLLSSNL